MIETVKLAEDSEEIIIRLYETAGARIQTNLYTGFQMSEAWLADLLEERIEPLDINEQTLSLTFTPFEIMTLRLNALSDTTMM